MTISFVLSCGVGKSPSSCRHAISRAASDPVGKGCCLLSAPPDHCSLCGEPDAAGQDSILA